MNRLRSLNAKQATCVLSLLLTPYAAPPIATAAGNPVIVKFTHAGSSGDRHVDVNLAVGQTLEVTIERTCEAFDVAIRGIVRAPLQGPRAQSGDALPLVDKTVSTVHEAQYGGYVVAITRKPDSRPCVDNSALENRLLFISARTLEWNLAFSGGFTVSRLRDPLYSARPDAEGVKRIVEEPSSQRDVAALGIAAFTHLYHERVPWFAMSFGLGIREDNKSQYYVGAGYRFSDKATFVGGMVLGPQSRLPNGVALGDEATDPNLLGSLPTRTGKGLFVGFSYSFIEVGERFKKPFAGTGSGDVGAAAATSQAGGGGTCRVGLKRDTADLSGLEFDAAAGEITVTTIGDPGCEWSIAISEDWLTAEPAKVAVGKPVTFRAKAGVATDRRAKVSFTAASGGVTEIQAIQKKKG